MAGQRVPGIGAPPQAEPRGVLQGETAACQVGPCRRALGGGQEGAEELPRQFQDLVQVAGGPPPRLGTGQHDTGTAGQELQGLAEVQPLRLHDEGEDVSTASASETVVVLALLRDVEGRSLLVVERTEPQITSARPVEPHPVADDLQDIQPFLDPSDVVILHAALSSLLKFDRNLI